MSFGGSLVWCGTFAAAPLLSSLSVDLFDVAGGDSIVLTGSNLTGLSNVQVGDGSTWTNCGYSGATSTGVTFTAPLKTAGSYFVRVITSAGTSNTLTIEAWAPTTDAAVTLLFDSKHTSYNPLAGTWAPRFTVLGGTAANLGMVSGSTANHSVSAGAPVFDGDGAGEGGLITSSALLSQFLQTTAGNWQDGSVAAVFKSTNASLLNVGAPYNNPCAVSNSTQGTVAIGFGNSPYGLNPPSIYAHIFDNSYNVRLVASTANTFHAAVARWAGGSNFDLSVDGALAGAGYDSQATINGNGTTQSYAQAKIELGTNYPGGYTDQNFAGTIAAFCVLNAKASDTFVTKFNKWRIARGWAS